MKKQKHHFTHALEQNIFFSNSSKGYPIKEISSITQIVVHNRIKVFQSAFEVKDLATIGKCRQANLLT